jgi:hypothetical protein
MEIPVKTHGSLRRDVMVFDAVLLLGFIAAVPFCASGQSFQLPDAPSTHLSKKFSSLSPF